MKEKTMLLEQLKLEYPEAKISYDEDNRKEIVIPDTPFKGITIEVTGRIDFVFKGFDLLDWQAISTYFRPRLKFQETRFFYNSTQINIYPDKKFSSGSKGDFEEAMWQTRLIQYVHSEVKKLIEEII